MHGIHPQPLFICASFLVAGLAILSPVHAQQDASAAFSSAAGAVVPLPSNASADQSIINGFTNQNPPANLFNNNGPATNYGLAPQFNQTGPGALTRLQYTGTGTVAYSDQAIPSFGAVNLGCGFGYIDPNFQAAYVGVSSAFYNRGYSCGLCIKLQCDDQTCAVPGTQAIAQIVDQCGACADADMNIAGPLFQKLSGRSGGSEPSIAISWQVVDCSPYINGTIKMLVKPGGTAYYQAFNFAESRQPITAVQVNGQLLQHQTNNYWSWNPTSGPINPQGPFDFALLGQNRQVLRVRLPQLRSIDLGIQFSATSQAAAVPAPEGPAATATPPVATATGATTGSAAPTPSG